MGLAPLFLSLCIQTEFIFFKTFQTKENKAYGLCSRVRLKDVQNAVSTTRQEVFRRCWSHDDWTLIWYRHQTIL